MTSHKALLEIGIEEIPASEVKKIVSQINEHLPALLEKQRIVYGNIRTFIASRRFGVLIEGLPEKQEDYFQEKRGPAEQVAFKDGKPTKALEGFLRSNSATVDDIEVREFKGTSYIFLKKRVEGKKTSQVLSEVFRELILGLQFKKPMRWGNGEYKFVRPVRWLVALFDDEALNLELFDKKASDTTYGHRFFFDETKVTPENYFETLKEALVIADFDERAQKVVNELERIEKEKDVTIPRDAELIEEVACITEFPTAVLGKFLPKYLNLPDEVIIVTIRHHQRTFPVYEANKLTNNFVAFQDGPADPKGNVRRGYEEVINARLEDAHFYFERDIQKPLEAYVEYLKEILFQRGLGTLYEKTERVRSLSKYIAELLNAKPDEEEAIERTALLAKADLTTRVVQEFPELQGIMGRIYALESGESDEVAWGIQEHYEPLDKVPETLTGAVVGVADRIDTLIGNFSLGNVPSGSKDPYGLRRKLSQIFETMYAFGWNMDLVELFKKAADNLGEDYYKIATTLEPFIKSRYEAFLLEKGYSINVARAVSMWWKNPYLGELVAKAISEIIGRDDFDKLLIAYQRVHNISKKHDSNKFDGSLFLKEAEVKLFNAYVKALDGIKKALEKRDFQAALKTLIALKEPIDEYFDEVFVMDSQVDIRLNRLGFLKALDELFFEVADLSYLINEEHK